MEDGEDGGGGSCGGGDSVATDSFAADDVSASGRGAGTGARGWFPCTYVEWVPSEAMQEGKDLEEPREEGGYSEVYYEDEMVYQEHAESWEVYEGYKECEEYYEGWGEEEEVEADDEGQQLEDAKRMMRNNHETVGLAGEIKGESAEDITTEKHVSESGNARTGTPDCLSNEEHDRDTSSDVASEKVDLP